METHRTLYTEINVVGSIPVEDTEAQLSKKTVKRATCYC